ncbi:hypothetical protein [Pimelobacter sp. 30-1]|uniref:hypothetical protein n=1 Tax=Pimelobacter sp. 30-1 TaxID=2004991 RepID=UPI001C05E285|nr:hypothetical protein [Pimelobacter sp. 30-1]MBU2698811.1 hypothetical protein [Pimelobacter sp. 30-1]
MITSLESRAAQAHSASVRLEVPALVAGLRELLGVRLVAYIGGVQEARAVRQWADPDDGRTPPAAVVQRLRTAYQVASIIGERDTAAVVQAWFQGMNPALSDLAPARLLRDGDPDAAARVLAAARAFAAAG